LVRYAIIIEKAANVGYGVNVPDLPGCDSMGSTRNKALIDIAVAIKFISRG